MCGILSGAVSINLAVIPILNMRENGINVVQVS